MRHKGHKPSKTRYHSRAERTITNDIQLRKHSGSSGHDGREVEDKDKYSEGEKRKGHEDSCPEGKREDTEVHEESIALGNSEHSEQSIHPGSIQELRELPASVQDTDETSPEEEEPPF